MTAGAAADLELRRDRGWLELRAPGGGAAGPPWGQPGLWRVVETPTLGRARVFELPERCLAGDGSGIGERDGGGEDDGQSPLSAALEWAAATEQGRVAPGWLPPPSDQLEALLPARLLVARAGACAAQGALLSGPGLLRLSLPLSTRPAASLPAARRAWAAACLADAQRRLRLVRAGVRSADEAFVAEIDLSGAPAELAARLLPVAAAALRAAGERLLPALSLLFETGSAVALLDQPPSAGSARGKDR